MKCLTSSNDSTIKAKVFELLDELQRRPHVSGRASLWCSIQEQERVRADDMRHWLRLLTRDLALEMEMEKSPFLTTINLRDVGRRGKRMCAAMHSVNTPAASPILVNRLD